MQTDSIDDLLDQLVAEYSDRVAAGDAPTKAEVLERVPAAARPGLERCLKMIDAGSAQAPGVMRPLTPGLQVDQFKLLRELGRGGMAIVWLAQDTELKRPVALKLLRPGLAFEERHVDRFRREALAIARLRHAHIVQIHGVGEAQGYHYLAMEFVEGPSLATVLAALPTDRSPTADDLARAIGRPSLAAPGRTLEQAIAALLAPVAEALHVAHQHGLVHRDVKPSNILIHDDGRAVIADFGLAKGSDDPALSLTGDPIGTPFYMSPEQAWLSGRKVDHRTDVYSLGVTLYEALSGQLPFHGKTALEVLEAIKSNLPPALRNTAPDSTRDAQSVVRKAMAREPEERYATADALHEDLVALAAGQGTRARTEEGGPMRRLWTHMRFATSGQTYEYRSARTLLGLPLIHAIGGARPPGSPPRVTKGWLAFGGEKAIGVMAFANQAYGLVFASGAIAVGGFAFGALGFGLIAFAGLGFGLWSFSGLAVAYIACGAVAIGYGAVGGWAWGKYALGGSPHGEYVIGGGRRDPEAMTFFEESVPLILKWAMGQMPGGEG